MDDGTYFATIAQVLPTVLIALGIEYAAMSQAEEFEYGDTFSASSLGIAFGLGELGALLALIWDPKMTWVLITLKVATGLSAAFLLYHASWLPFNAIEARKRAFERRKKSNS